MSFNDYAFRQQAERKQNKRDIALIKFVCNQIYDKVVMSGFDGEKSQAECCRDILDKRQEAEQLLKEFEDEK